MRLEINVDGHRHTITTEDGTSDLETLLVVTQGDELKQLISDKLADLKERAERRAKAKGSKR